VVTEHRELADAVLDRNADKAVPLIYAHYQRTVTLLTDDANARRSR
jgi:DNA-binding GntR family transcriptional regulator